MAEVKLLETVPIEPIMIAQEAIHVPHKNDPPRLDIDHITPLVGDGRYNVKRTIGDVVRVECDILIEGHEAVGAAVLWRPADSEAWRRVPMSVIVNDRWHGEFQLNRTGQFYYCIEAWRDEVASFQHDLAKKIAAGQKVDLEVAEGDLLLERVETAAKSGQDSGAATILHRVRQRLKTVPSAARQQFYCSTEFHQALQAADIRSFVSRSNIIPVWADRYAARFSSWYELFPRSQSESPTRHGTFADVEKRLPALQAMGFDTLYFPPIHPIGRVNRKGKNNSLVANSDDPGSPYAIGAEEGGHDALHPELGTLEDFKKLQDAAHRHGMELALDFALQCAPDHPWLKSHPEWFSWRPDGTIRYAENPPKKYEDIVNFDFYAEAAIPGLWHALRDVVLFWCEQGIRAFRVDNPHTKPFPFWAWLIPEIQSKYPDALFLAEAFTRPKTMYHLAEIGFSQSYTYFTWRHTKPELEEYLVELTEEAPRDFFRPHFFVNTPDINPYFLQTSGRPGFLIRAALACTLSGLWGMYNGFELCEATPIPGKEEYLDSEKYQLRHWDDKAPGNIIAEISQLNRLRRENPALHSHLGLRFHRASHDQIIYYSKSTPTMDNVLLVAVNLDPINSHVADIEIPLWLWKLPDTGSLEATDLINARRFIWAGKNQRIELSPQGSPYAIWRIRPARKQ
jgi:starch synthase (maltosyl-transferring)